MSTTYRQTIGPPFTFRIKSADLSMKDKEYTYRLKVIVQSIKDGNFMYTTGYDSANDFRRCHLNKVKTELWSYISRRRKNGYKFAIMETHISDPLSKTYRIQLYYFQQHVRVNVAF